MRQAGISSLIGRKRDRTTVSVPGVRDPVHLVKTGQLAERDDGDELACRGG